MNKDQTNKDGANREHLECRIAWVTGGSRGIGAACVVSLAKEGFDVAFTYLSNEKAALEVAVTVKELGRKALPLRGDVGDIQVVENMHQKIENELGIVDTLVNSAGLTRDPLVLMLEEEDWSKVMNTNLMGAVHTSKIVVRGMMKKRFGRIINISSVAATKGGRGQANYAASKAALEAFTRSLATEIGSKNITVNCVAPGVINTDMSKEVVHLAKDEIMKRQVIKRLGTPEEIAAGVMFIASTSSGFMTGQTLHIDGGMKMP